MPYTEFQFGSEWRKWDLHVHTPYSYHNDFPNWTDYVSKLKEHAVTHDIEVVGITDYFSVDGYKELLKECDPPHPKSPRIILSNGKSLFIIPIVELRLDNFTAGNNSVNVHVAFSPHILPETIQQSFLEKLSIKYQALTLTLNEPDLIKIGHAEENSGQFDVNLNISAMNAQQKRKLVTKALSAITFSSSTFEEALDGFSESIKNAGFKKDSYLIIIANKGHGGLSDFKWSETNRDIGRAGIIRQNLLNLCDICFSNNPDDKKFLLGSTTGTPKKEVINRFRSLKPCVWGSDAHNVTNLFHPSNGATTDYTWIKADPTFEGLRQTLFEPEDRVKIQTVKPDVKNARNLIQSVKFLGSNETFGTNTIYLNDNLNAIIGGKSSGKSLLLYATASSIDPEQVASTSSRLRFDGYTFDQSFDFEVIWKNGEQDRFTDAAPSKTHKITYIPQLYINYLVEKDNKDDLNSLVRSILNQDSTYKSKIETINETIAAISQRTTAHLSSYIQTRTKLIGISSRLKEIGKSEAIRSEIQKIELLITESKKNTTLTPEEFSEYQVLLQRKSTEAQRITDLGLKEYTGNKILNELTTTKNQLVGEDLTTGVYNSKGSLEQMVEEFPAVSPAFADIFQFVKDKLNDLITDVKSKIDNLGISTERNTVTLSAASIEDSLKPYLEKLSGQEDVKKLALSLETEKGKLAESIKLENQFNSGKAEYDALRGQIALLLKNRYQQYQAIVDYINKDHSTIAAGISLNAKLLYKKEDFVLYDQVNKAAIANDSYFYELFDEDLVDYEGILEMVGNLIRVVDGILRIEPDKSIQLKQNVTLESVLEGLIKDGFKIDYSVTYKGDDLLKMSPGKKGTVLLILFLQISSSEFPILIDQPEDNLDNRTIYDLLCSIIKQKKKERQIIIVSHNANLVVATDAENIIVANQEGQERPLEDGEARFEYVNGSIENTFEKNEAIRSVLLQQGTREHVCDILEGGNEAFRQREQKYSIAD